MNSSRSMLPFFSLRIVLRGVAIFLFISLFSSNRLLQAIFFSSKFCKIG